MRTLLNEIKQIDDHVLNQVLPQDALLFEANMIINPELKYKVLWHKQTLGLVQQYGRDNLRTEIEAVHRQLFTQPRHQSFAQKVIRLFKR